MGLGPPHAASARGQGAARAAAAGRGVSRHEIGTEPFQRASYCREIEDEPDIFVTPETLAGVWANDVRAYRTPHEITVDFVRMDPIEAQGVRVARVSCSPLTAGELVDKLTPLWRQWIGENLPPEMTDGIS